MDDEFITDVAKAIPDSAWDKLTDTACETFKETVAPITAITGGIGRLIESKFDSLVEFQKVTAATTLSKALSKVEKAEKTPAWKKVPQGLLQYMEKGTLQEDPTLQELWANLLAQEMTQNEVHPEMPRILSRLSPLDAELFISIAENHKEAQIRRAMNHAMQLSQTSKDLDRLAHYVSQRNPPSLSHSILQGFNLIDYKEKVWAITTVGVSFYEAVTDPTLQKENDEQEEPETSYFS